MFQPPDKVNPYWENLIEPTHAYRDRIIEILKRYPIERPKPEFIVHPDVAVNLVDDFESLGVAVEFVGVWCFVASPDQFTTCCPYGMGGPRKIGTENQWFTEYAHLGYSVPDFEDMPKSIDLAHRCNPLVKHYLLHQLPFELGYNSCIRVSLYLYAPMTWDFFADWTAGS